MEPTGVTATALARLIARREVSAREVAEAHLRRIEAVNPLINAVVALDAERALAAADAADAAAAPTGPLHGVPFTVKDNLAAAGLEMAIGAPERVGVVPGADATAVARMRAAGAILLGKTNCPEYGGGIETDNPVHGRTSNPYDPARTPGGSSGGEAAIIAAEGSPCGLGTDSGASVRLPAHFCGLASLKPSAGPRPAHRRARRRGAARHARRPAHAGRPARALGRGRRAAAARRGRPDGHDGGVAPVAARRARGGRAARPARRRADRERPRRADARDGRRRRGGRGRAAGGGRERRGRAPSRTAGTS